MKVAAQVGSHSVCFYGLTQQGASEYILNLLTMLKRNRLQYIPASTIEHVHQLQVSFSGFEQHMVTNIANTNERHRGKDSKIIHRSGLPSKSGSSSILSDSVLELFTKSGLVLFFFFEHKS